MRKHHFFLFPFSFSLLTTPVPVIEVNGLTKAFRTYKKQPGFGGAVKGLFRRQYEQTVAVNEVSFRIEPGELVGFLGPNGAGKTTTLKMLAGLLYPSSGQAKVLGYTPWERDDGYRRQFALVLGQKNQLWWDLPARESLQLNAEIYGIPKDRFEATVGELTELLAVQHKLNVSVRELSLGERMKMELIASLLHQPRVLFLDEPTIGLDVVSQKTVREFIKRHNAAHKTTILLTSHYMADIQELCERVINADNTRHHLVLGHLQRCALDECKWPDCRNDLDRHKLSHRRSRHHQRKRAQRRRLYHDLGRLFHASHRQ